MNLCLAANLALPLIMLTTPLHAVEIIAHRGASHEAPENTLAAIRPGWQQADAVEIDIRLSRDGQIVLHHDDNTNRVAGVDKKVVGQTLAELRQLDVGRWKNARFTGEKIPTLDEVLATIPDGKRLFIEIKCGPEVIPTLQEALARCGKPNARFVIIAFSYSVLRAVKKALPEVETYWLAGFTQDKETKAFSPRVEDLIRKAKTAGFTGLNLNYKGPIDASLVRQVKAAGLKCFVWTVNSVADARTLVAAGVDGITTDRPAWLAGQLDEVASQT